MRCQQLHLQLRDVEGWGQWQWQCWGTSVFTQRLRRCPRLPQARPPGGPGWQRSPGTRPARTSCFKCHLRAYFPSALSHPAVASHTALLFYLWTSHVLLPLFSSILSFPDSKTAFRLAPSGKLFWLIRAGQVALLCASLAPCDLLPFQWPVTSHFSGFHSAPSPRWTWGLKNCPMKAIGT